MGNFKGTPGKWESDFISINKNSPELCCIWGDGTTKEGGSLIAHIDVSPGYEQAEANALLISKAPELLEALSQLVHAIKFRTSVGTDLIHELIVSEKILQAATILK